MLLHIDAQKIMAETERRLEAAYHTTPDKSSAIQLHDALSQSLIEVIAEPWTRSTAHHRRIRHAYYFSAEFLVGRAIYNNLLCLGLTEEIGTLLRHKGASLGTLEEIEDMALGNGGLGRLAACFLDSAATLSLPLDGYGIRYKYGLFKQEIDNGFQKEAVDDWTRHGDPWSVRREDEAVEVCFGDQTVRAIPYDMPVLGYHTDNIGTLRLWQAEAIEAFDFQLFNDQRYDDAVRAKNRAEDISRVLYPNDTTDEGKQLRLKQQYFFCSASLTDIIRNYKKLHGNDFSQFADLNAIQLNDTHPVISIPELIRQLTENEGLTFDEAFEITRHVFSYTNHTIMAEALEKWHRGMIEHTVPALMPIISALDERCMQELRAAGVPDGTAQTMRIIQYDMVQMAYLAVYVSRYVNGVARLHTEILKDRVLHDWYAVYPDRFQNKTNGVTQRRWLALANPELAALLTRLLGSDVWKTDLAQLSQLTRYEDDEAVLREFLKIKQSRKQSLAVYLKNRDGIVLDPNSILDVQIKRLHEYKRQFLNVLAILEIYFEIKDGSLRDFTPTTFLFAAKAAPGYARAKGIIKLISEVACLIDNDPDVNHLLHVHFVPNYNVSSAQHIIAAADISEQISTAGTEASGTGNMKLMANGAVTLGTYDGANVEIVEEAGRASNYIFGANVEEIADRAPDYNPRALYDSDNRIHRVLDALDNGMLDDGGTGIFAELKQSLLADVGYSKADQYYLLLDFGRYLDAKIQVNRDYANQLAFAKKCWINICHCGKFSSDRTIAEYAKDIWQIEA